MPCSSATPLVMPKIRLTILGLLLLSTPLSAHPKNGGLGDLPRGAPGTNPLGARLVQPGGRVMPGLANNAVGAPAGDLDLGAPPLAGDLVLRRDARVAAPARPVAQPQQRPAVDMAEEVVAAGARCCRGRNNAFAKITVAVSNYIKWAADIIPASFMGNPAPHGIVLDNFDSPAVAAPRAAQADRDAAAPQPREVAAAQPLSAQAAPDAAVPHKTGRGSSLSFFKWIEDRVVASFTGNPVPHKTGRGSAKRGRGIIAKRGPGSIFARVKRRGEAEVQQALYDQARIYLDAFDEDLRKADEAATTGDLGAALKACRNAAKNAAYYVAFRNEPGTSSYNIFTPEERVMLLHRESYAHELAAKILLSQGRVYEASIESAEAEILHMEMDNFGGNPHAAAPREVAAAPQPVGEVAAVQPEVAVEAAPQPVGEVAVMQPVVAVAAAPQPVGEVAAVQPEAAVEAAPQPVVEVAAAPQPVGEVAAVQPEVVVAVTAEQQALYDQARIYLGEFDENLRMADEAVTAGDLEAALVAYRNADSLFSQYHCLARQYSAAITSYDIFTEGERALVWRRAGYANELAAKILRSLGRVDEALTESNDAAYKYDQASVYHMEMGDFGMLDATEKAGHYRAAIGALKIALEFYRTELVGFERLHLRGMEQRLRRLNEQVQQLDREREAREQAQGVEEPRAEDPDDE